MKKLLVALAAGLVLTSAPAWAQKVLRLSHNAAPGNPKAEASLKFAELVNQKTDGRVKVEVGGSAQFGDDVESLTNMRLGSLAFAANSQGSTSGVVPQFALIGLPFLFRDLPHAYKVVDGPFGKELTRLAEEKGLVRAGDLGQRHPPHQQQQAPDHQARGPERHQAAHAARSDDDGHLHRARREPGAAGLLRAVHRAAAGCDGRPGESADEHLVVKAPRGAEAHRADRPQVRDHAAAGEQEGLQFTVGRGSEGDLRGRGRGWQAEPADVDVVRGRPAPEDGSRRRAVHRSRQDRLRRQDQAGVRQVGQAVSRNWSSWWSKRLPSHDRGADRRGSARRRSARSRRTVGGQTGDWRAASRSR